MVFDKKAYDAKWHKEQSKLKAVRYNLSEVAKVEAYCDFKNVEYSKLVKELINEAMKRDNWKYNPPAKESE